jgi:hypothetical protein
MGKMLEIGVFGYQPNYVCAASKFLEVGLVVPKKIIFVPRMEH